jgi:hypothetical protein
MIMLFRSFCYIPIEEMWLWGEMESLDNALYFYGKVFHSY